MTTQLEAHDIVHELESRIKGDVYSDIFHRVAFATDASIYRIVPMCVVSPRDSEDVAETVRFAGEKGISVIPRGAGSGLAGESLGAGIVLDTARYMNRIVGTNDDNSVVTCEPGAVLDDVNDYLAKFGKKIGPDPSSGNRAVMGGVAGNNSTGSHSLQFGYISEHIESLEAVLADGSVVEVCNDMLAEEIENLRLKDIASRCAQLLGENQQIISESLPGTHRNRSGYLIGDVFHDGRIDMARMLAGSEGSLAVFTRMSIRTVDVPAEKALLQLEFNVVNHLAKSVPIVVESGASACEMMDQDLLTIARESLPQYADLYPGEARAVLLVEHVGADRDELEAKIKNTAELVGPLAKQSMTIFDADQQKRIWKSRKDAVPLLFREKTDKRPVPFIEDVSVENSRLGEYLQGLDKIFQRHNTPSAYYGHAGDGELHVRPYLDLRSADDVQKMKDIADEVFELAWSLGGTISGEHGEGLVRAAYIKRQYGEKFYEIMRQVKNIFDPANVLNPGKIINDDPDVMTKNLRVERKFIDDRLGTNLNFEPNEFRLEIEQCNGDGVCLSKQASQRMCPVFRAMGDELACSRAKANLLQAWITGLLEEKDFESEDFKKILELCVNCKMCSVQCPSGVDISKLMLEARAEYVRRKGLSRAEWVLSHNRFMSVMGSLFSPLSNFVISLRPVGWLLEKFTGLDRRRKLPTFGRGSFVKKADAYLKNAEPIAEPVDKVVYFTDTFVNYNDHELGFTVLKFLRSRGIDVVVPKQRPAPIPAAVYGDVKTARADLEYNIRNLIGYVREGRKVICSEPSAALLLRDELRLFVDSDDAREVADNVCELMSYLRDMEHAGRIAIKARNVSGSFAYHSPCHLCAMDKTGASIELLTKLCSADIVDIDAGCCGLAGTCGMQKKNYDLSVDIAGDMVAKLRDSQAQLAVTECSACKMQIEQLTDKKVFHPIRILAQACDVV